MSARGDERREWERRVVGFNPRQDATASAQGLRYDCEIQGPFCGTIERADPKAERRVKRQKAPPESASH